MNFNELGLSDDILQGVQALGYENPTPIQTQAIPKLLQSNQDLVALAQTGTGKTAGFGLPLLDKIDASRNVPQALVLSPTRELCNQIADDFKGFAKFKKGIKVLSVYGGASIDTQIRSLKQGVNVVVATPGRLSDLIRRKKIDLSEVKIVVLDEADEMLNMGFKEELDNILEQTPSEKNTWLFSATMALDVERIANNYMNSPFKIVVGGQNEGSKNIDHKVYVVQHRNRYEALKRIVDSKPDIFGLIFCRTKIDTQNIADRLMAEGYNVDSLHGDLSQNQRDRVMDKFRERKIQLLCATDVAARGIDVSDITHVINYELPDESESYTHRSGRTARAGKKGESIAIITPKEKGKLSRIEKIIKSKFILCEVPNGKEVCKSQIFNMIDLVKTNVIDAEFENYADKIYEAFAENTKEEVIQMFLAKEFNRVVSYYSDSYDINEKLTSGGREERFRSDRPDRRRGERNDRAPRGDRNDRAQRVDRPERSSRPERNFSGERSVRGDRGSRVGNSDSDQYKTVFLNVGSSDNMNVGKLIDLVCNTCDVKGRSLGRIRLNDRFSFVEVENNVAKTVLEKLGKGSYEGRELRAEFAKPRV
jgi:ATP-dependent RNA helicase DeaD